MLAALGQRGARARSQGLLCMGSGARSPGPGCTDSSVRAVPEEAQRQKLGSTAACGFCKPVPLSQSVAAQVPAGDVSGPRPLTAGLNDRHARAKP